MTPAKLHQNCLGSDNVVLCYLASASVQARFWSKVRKSERGCWLWTGARGDRYGHGAFTVRLSGYSRQLHIYAHRISWVLAHGPIPIGSQINHHCDVPHCVRPDHLYAGTQLDNLRDASRRGRLPRARRPRKLSDRDVLAIRRMKDDGAVSVDLAAQFNVTPALISQIANGKRRTVLRSQGPVL